MHVLHTVPVQVGDGSVQDGSTQGAKSFYAFVTAVIFIRLPFLVLAVLGKAVIKGISAVS